MGYVGSSVKRVEDPRFIQGKGSYVGNISMPGMVYLAIKRSPYGHAKIKKINTKPALAIEGVEEVLTGADLAPRWGEGGTLPCAWPVTDDMLNPPHLPVAVGEAKYVGDAVAIVLATSRYAAADGAAAVVVDYATKPAVVDLEAAVSDGSPLVHDDLATNAAYTWELIPDADAVEQAFADATRVVRERDVHQRLIPAAMEPRGVAAGINR